jgi:hypothetical protein
MYVRDPDAPVIQARENDARITPLDRFPWLTGFGRKVRTNAW